MPEIETQTSNNNSSYKRNTDKEFGCALTLGKQRCCVPEWLFWWNREDRPHHPHSYRTVDSDNLQRNCTEDIPRLIKFTTPSVCTDNLNNVKKKILSVWCDRSDDESSIHILITDTIIVWEENLSLKHKPSSIQEEWGTYSSKLLHILQNNPANASYDLKYCQSDNNNNDNSCDINITIKEEAPGGGKKILLKEFILIKRNDSNSLQNFHQVISKKLKIQNERNQKYLQDKLNQSTEIEDLRVHLQQATEDKKEYTSKVISKMIIVFNSKRRQQGNNDNTNNNNSNESDDDSFKDADIDDIKPEPPKKKLKSGSSSSSSSHNGKKLKSESSSSSSSHNDKKRATTSCSIKGKTVVDINGLDSILASQSQVPSSQAQSQAQSQSRSQKEHNSSANPAFKYFDDDDDDDIFDL